MNAHSLIGSYHLVSWHNVDSAGRINYPLGKDASGYINYTDDGYMYVHLMAKRRPKQTIGDLFSGDPNELMQSASSHLSYCGTYELLENEVIHHVQISSYPNWVNTQQRRQFSFVNGCLQLSALNVPFADGAIDAHLVWRRVTTE